ncbi:MFS transporter, NHS family, nucleoside permease/MFS transporter, NHS family, xanthosine permease [Porphyromonadaceae bacterium KH3R12]|nr:MFS transporter, NHS family, nucleoside permease/MFS transporter, NHS family, xanthosine permease [Porphyromonadaceae bacterium KH3R12]SFL03843.1 MFS transporter, NHS family, nucleoside permease/MFS transporter, NHS family, xanthosine permease [Porphyromonadaceae bacterium KH3CP3RA]
MSLRIRLIIMNFLQFAIWGAYLTSMSRYLGPAGLGSHIGIFYSVQGIVSIFMPAIMGIVADRWVPAQKLLGVSHLLAASFMLSAGLYGLYSDGGVSFSIIFTLYTLSVAFYMPTLALSNSVAYTILEKGGMDTVKAFPPIRVFGTIGFICTMWLVDILGYQTSSMQFVVSAVLGFMLGIYAFTLPNCPVSTATGSKTLFQALGLDAFKLFKIRKMAIFFIFSMLLGVALQITNGFANPFIASFEAYPEYAGTFGVKHSNILISLSQISEALCILLIPFFLKRYGIKNVMLMAMFAWVLRFGFFGLGNPGSGVWLLVFSMLVYGVAFDFFNVSGSLFVDKETPHNIRASAQGMFMLMTNGIGATIGTLWAQSVVNRFCSWTDVTVGTATKSLLVGDWQSVWFIFAGYALMVTILFAILFRYKHVPDK